MEYRTDTLAGFLRSWWESCGSRSERVALVVLSLVCVTTIFSTALVQTLVVTLTVVVCSGLVSVGSPVFRRTPLDAPFLVFILARVVSVFFSRDPAQSLPALHLEFFFYIVFFLVTQSAWQGGAAATWALTTLLLCAGMAAGLIGVLKVLLFEAPRGLSTTAGPYTLGAYLCPVLALALLLPPRRGTRITEVVRSFGSLVLCLGIICTLDRLHWVAMTLVLLGAGLLTRRRMSFILLCAVGAAFVLLPQVRFRVVQASDSGALLTGRDVLWRGASMLLSSHPIVGFGPRTFTEIFPLPDLLPIRGVGSWHNDYLQVYMESGLLALVPLLWLIAATYRQGWRLLHSAAVPEEVRTLALALLAALSVTFLFGGMRDTLVGIEFRVLLGLFALLASSIGSGGNPVPVELHP